MAAHATQTGVAWWQHGPAAPTWSGLGCHFGLWWQATPISKAPVEVWHLNTNMAQVAAQIPGIGIAFNGIMSYRHQYRPWLQQGHRPRYGSQLQHGLDVTMVCCGNAGHSDLCGPNCSMTLRSPLASGDSPDARHLHGLRWCQESEISTQTLAVVGPQGMFFQHRTLLKSFLFFSLGFLAFLFMISFPPYLGLLVPSLFSPSPPRLIILLSCCQAFSLTPWPKCLLLLQGVR